eukprot:6552658-Prymnesium_polylepis.2
MTSQLTFLPTMKSKFSPAAFDAIEYRRQTQSSPFAPEQRLPVLRAPSRPPLVSGLQPLTSVEAFRGISNYRWVGIVKPLAFS